VIYAKFLPKKKERKKRKLIAHTKIIIIIRQRFVFKTRDDDDDNENEKIVFFFFDDDDENLSFRPDLFPFRVLGFAFCERGGVPSHGQKFRLRGSRIEQECLCEISRALVRPL